MLALIAFLFVLLPIVEIAVLIKVGTLIGVWNTIALIVLTAILGGALLRNQGLAVFARAQASLARNVFPTTELFDGACIGLAGVLLIVPGFVTDTIGLLLFLPPVRHVLRRLIWRHLARGRRTRVWIDGEEVTRPGADGEREKPTIEGEWREIDPEEERRRDPPRDDSPWGNGRNGR